MASDSRSTSPGFESPCSRAGSGPRLLQDLYIAEVLLSLDASEDARDYFRSVLAPGSAETDTARLSAAVVLSQVLLLEGKHDEYAELATETLAPLLLKRHRSRPGSHRPTLSIWLARCRISSAAWPCCRSRPGRSSPGCSDALR